MQSPSKSFARLIQQYYMLLQRYARRIIRDEEAAGDIASKTLLHWSAENPEHSNPQLQREQLKKAVLRHCRQWLATAAFLPRCNKE